MITPESRTDVAGHTPVGITELLVDALDALRPFAAMHREGTPPDEVAVVRGWASDMTMLTSADFQRAHEIITKANAPVERRAPSTFARTTC
jgi:hypothetical protein